MSRPAPFSIIGVRIRLPGTLARHLAAVRRNVPDSRLRHEVAVGAAGMVRRHKTVDGRLEVLYCLNCGRKAGAVTVELPPGVIYVCEACNERMGPLPLEAVNFPVIE